MYHFRNILGTVQDHSIIHDMEVESFDTAISLAYNLSAEKDMGIYVCRNSGTIDHPAYVEVACVRACK